METTTKIALGLVGGGCAAIGVYLIYTTWKRYELLEDIERESDEFIEKVEGYIEEHDWPLTEYEKLMVKTENEELESKHAVVRAQGWVDFLRDLFIKRYGIYIIPGTYLGAKLLKFVEKRWPPKRSCPVPGCGYSTRSKYLFEKHMHDEHEVVEENIGHVAPHWDALPEWLQQIIADTAEIPEAIGARWSSLSTEEQILLCIAIIAVALIIIVFAPGIIPAAGAVFA